METFAARVLRAIPWLFYSAAGILSAVAAALVAALLMEG